MYVSALAWFSIFGIQCFGYPYEKDDASPLFRIIGGKPAKQGHAPSIVALQNKRGRFVCGGALITESIILTAAHCIITRILPNGRGTETKNGKKKIWWVRAGGTHKRKLKQRRKISRVICHPKYGPNVPEYKGSDKLHNDICVLKVNTPFKLKRKNVEVAKLNDQKPKLGDHFSAFGWGSNQQKQKQKHWKHHLQVLSGIDLMPWDQCKRRLKDMGNKAKLEERLEKRLDHKAFCTKQLPGTDTCKGDSGGPLYIQNGNSRKLNIIAGIVSWGPGCAKTNAPAIYTDVFKHARWIKKILRRLEGKKKKTENNFTDRRREVKNEEKTSNYWPHNYYRKYEIRRLF